MIVIADDRMNLVALDVRGSHTGTSRVPKQADVETVPLRVSTGHEGLRL